VSLPIIKKPGKVAALLVAFSLFIGFWMPPALSLTLFPGVVAGMMFLAINGAARGRPVSCRKT